MWGLYTILSRQVNGQEMVDNCSSPDLPSGVLTCAMFARMVVLKVIDVEALLNWHLQTMDCVFCAFHHRYGFTRSEVGVH